MWQDSDWYYVQARLQARHGERLQERDWLVLEAAQSLEHYLERARSTSLRRFTEHLSGQLSGHAIERALRTDWRAYVSEVAAWVPRAWQPSVMWVTYLPDLPVLEHLLAGQIPAWAREDPVYAPLAGIDVQVRGSFPMGTPLYPLAHSRHSTTTVPALWLRHWRALWPSASASQLQGLDDLVASVISRRGQSSGTTDAGSVRRADLLRAVVRLFRRHGVTPVAMFSSLLLLALDLERLRGGLVRRCLFVSERPRETT